MELRIEAAAAEELPALLALQKLAFKTAAELCGDFSIPPLRETIEELVENGRGGLVLMARSGNELVGTVRGRQEDGTFHVARLAVHPNFRRRGIARRLLEELERRAEEAPIGPSRYELFTAAIDAGAIALYEGCGYRIFRKELPPTGPVLVYMEKSAPR